TKQGNTLLRWLLVEAATTAQRFDASWHRQYVRLSMNKHHGVAKVAIAFASMIEFLNFCKGRRLCAAWSLLFLSFV
ncbi:MAG TPA: hypothetical protein VGR71_12595, partial [Nitrospira sp.]|nr:hypothetical protein [Nitrospira sp.]